MAIRAVVVVTTLIVVACFVGPGCWGDEWIHRGKYFTVLTALGKVFSMWGGSTDCSKSSSMARGDLLLGYLKTYVGSQ